MSFMYNPFPYDDPKPVNRPELSEKVKESMYNKYPDDYEFTIKKRK